MKEHLLIVLARWRYGVNILIIDVANNALHAMKITMTLAWFSHTFA